MRKINIYITDKFVTSKDFSNNDILTYLALRKIIKKDCYDYFISIGLLSYELAGKQVLHKTITASLLSGSSGLLSKGYIKQKGSSSKLGRKGLIVDLSKLYINEEKIDSRSYYSAINSDHVLKLVNSSLKERLPLIRFYCYVMTTVAKTGDKAGVGFTSYTKMANEFGSCRQTISKYMDILAKYKILYVYKSRFSLVNNNGEIQEISNTYGDITNESKIISVGKQYEDAFGDKNKSLSSKKSTSRSASIKYNYIQKDIAAGNDIRYSYSEMKDIYDSLVGYNDKYSKHDGCQKDLSIFCIYDFYKS